MSAGICSKTQDDERSGGSGTRPRRGVHFVEDEVRVVELRSSLLAEMELECPPTRNIQFHQDLQIKEYYPDRRKIKRKFLRLYREDFTFQRTLSALVLDEDVPRINKICPGCVVSGSLQVIPLQRNVFQIEPVKSLTEIHDANSVRYGQDLYITLTDKANCTKLYMSCKKVPPDELLFNIQEYPVKMSAVPDQHSIFQILHSNDKNWKKSYMRKITANSKVLIRHKKTKHLMAYMYTHYESRLLESMEQVVACPEIDMVPQTLWNLHMGY